MKTKYLRKIWDVISKRAITFYLIIFILSHWLIDYEKVSAHARGAALSRLMPSFDYLHNLAAGFEELDVKKLEEYEYYYAKVVEFVPRAEAFGILGYIYFQLGKDKKALPCFQTAIVLNPSAFSFYYNLGIIYFRRQFYGEAIEAFKKAVATSIDDNLSFITSSKMYYPFLDPSDDMAHQLKSYLRKSFRNAYRLMIISSLYLKDYQQLLRWASEAIASALDDNKDFYYYAGLASFHIKDYKQAGAFLKEYVTANPGDGDGMYYLGLTLKALGEDSGAGKVLQKAELLHNKKSSIIDKDSMISLNIF